MPPDNNQNPAEPQPPSCRKRLSYRKVGVLITGLLVLALGLYLFRAPILTGLARAWIVDEPPRKADAILLLGGGLQYRPFAAARLYQQGYAPVVLITHVKTSPTDDMGLTRPERDVQRDILLKQGVPEAAILTLGTNVTSTYEEALAVRDWVNSTGSKRLLITTEIFHTRRVRWLFRHVLAEQGTGITLAAVEPNEYGATNWWQHEAGLIYFQNEWVKLPYYWWKY